MTNRPIDRLLKDFPKAFDDETLAEVKRSFRGMHEIEMMSGEVISSTVLLEAILNEEASRRSSAEAIPGMNIIF